VDQGVRRDLAACRGAATTEKGGVTIGVASQILGHSSNILQKRYGHLETGALQDAALSVLGG
jgi:hypothetical protein